MPFLSRKPTVWSLLCFALGLILLATYWMSVRPIDAGRPGYSEDMCYIDMGRHMMADEIQDFGHPKFTTDRFMQPYGMSVPYLAWSPENDWLGAKAWAWDRNFPFQWAFLGLSFLITYIGVGFILLRMGLPGVSAWSIATAVVIFHVPRHFKMWHHYEHLPEHWIYFCLFIDAWLWQRFYRERVWSWKLELWRVVAGLGSLGSAGYFWGALILEWVIVRAALLIMTWRRRQRGEKTAGEAWRFQSAVLPGILIVTLCVLWAQWYPPLAAEAQSGGEVWQGISWWANGSFVLRPLWIEFFMTPAHPIDTPETVVTIGWFYWIPFFTALWFVRKNKNGPGWGLVAPFLIYLVVALLYATLQKPLILSSLIQTVIPFMKFFRVASRWGLFLPQLLTAMIVLAWPELTAAWQKGWRTRKPVLAAGLAVFAVMSVAEASWLRWPVNMSPAMNTGMATMLEKIRQTPGSALLDLPFCVAGGNGYCTAEQCPNYPASTLGICLRNFHDKKIYGLYSARMLAQNCDIYNREPFTEWFSAWKQQRCFTAPEWDQFCGYLDHHTELSAVLLYPGIWFGARTPECQEQFRQHLGQPLGQETIFAAPTRGGQGATPTEIQWFAPKCQKI